MRKYKIIIADDEPSPREGLTAFFCNEDCGFEVAGVADGGLQALAMTMQMQPDVLITDIRMPDMDGLELARRCMELPHPPRLLIMSSYDDAVYIKTALKLKPLDLGELTAVMKQMREMLDKAAEEQWQRDAQREKMNRSLEWLRRHFLQELVSDTYREETEIEEKLAFLDMRLPAQALYFVACVDVDDRDMRREANGQEQNFSLQGLMEDVLSLHGDGYVFEYEKNGFVFLLMDEGNDEAGLAADMKNICSEVMETLYAGGISATIGVDRVLHFRKELAASFRSARENVKARLVLGSNRVISDYKADGEEKQELAAAAKTVRERLANMDAEALKNALNQYFKILGQRKDISLLYAIQHVSLLVGETKDVLPEMGGRDGERTNAQLAAYEELTRCETLPEMKEVVTNYLLELNAAMCDCTKSATEETVEKIKKIVRERYMEPLSIRTVAEQVYLTPNYICMIFKQNTGQTVNQYITEVRIEMAKKCLEDPSVRLADIGAMVGYTEPSYFSKIFKKYVALTPKEYRQMYISLKERQGTGRT